jgi:hypothetical protein
LVKKTPPKELTDEEFRAQLSEAIRGSAEEAAKQIKEMITGADVSDATRLAACKYAIEHAMGEKTEGESKDAALSLLMQFVREARQEKGNERATPIIPLDPEAAPESADKDWGGWVKSNLNKPN